MIHAQLARLVAIRNPDLERIDARPMGAPGTRGFDVEHQSLESGWIGLERNDAAALTEQKRCP